MFCRRRFVQLRIVNSNNAVKEIVAVGGAVVPLGTGFANPFEVAVDDSGNVSWPISGHNAVKEILAVDGVIPVSPTIITIGSGFSSPTGVALR